MAWQVNCTGIKHNTYSDRTSGKGANTRETIRTWKNRSPTEQRFAWSHFTVGIKVHGRGLRPLASWNCAFESRLRHRVCLFCVLCVVRNRSLRRADPSSREILPSVEGHCVWSINIKKEEVLAGFGLLRQRNNSDLLLAHVYTVSQKTEKYLTDT